MIGTSRATARSLRTIACAAAAAAAAIGPGAVVQAQGQGRAVPAAPVIGTFAACAARRWPDQARALMATPVGSRQERRAGRRLAEGRGDCLQRRFASLSMQTGALRGGVAAALLEDDPAALARLRAVPPRPAVRPELKDGRAMVAAFSHCIADAEPARASRLLDLPIEAGPTAHSAALLALGDLLNDCTPLGPTFRFSPLDVRDHIAARLYDIAFAIAR